MTALHCRRGGCNVLLLDSQKNIGAKILMSGGTRCNLTNLTVTEKDYSSENLRFARNVLRAFSPVKAKKFFEDLGVPVVVEEEDKVFPLNQSAKTVLDAFLKAVSQEGIALKTSSRVAAINFKSPYFYANGEGFEYCSRAVVLCAGGLSYPSTGSNGKGYELAKVLGHPMVATSAALTPLKTDDRNWKSLMGVSFPCRLTVFTDENHVSFEGPFLFTHFGFSGTVALNISRYWDRGKNKKYSPLMISFLPTENNQTLQKKWLDAAREHPQQTIKGFLSRRLPERFVEVFLKKINLEKEVRLSQVPKVKREEAIRKILHYPLEVTDVYGYQKAEVTAGGVDLRNIDDATMESRLQPGLFFAGEILDVDGRIGGFNFQWAWASGAVAAQGVMKRLRANHLP